MTNAFIQRIYANPFRKKRLLPLVVEEHEHRALEIRKDFALEEKIAYPLESKHIHLPIAAHFSLDDVEAAKKTAFAEGFDEGLDSAKNQNEEHIKVIMQELLEAIDRRQAYHHQERDAWISLLIKVLEMLFPSLQHITAEAEVRKCLETVLETPQQGMTYTLRIHPTLVVPIQKYCLDQKTFGETFEIIGDENIVEGDCKIAWKKGYMEKNAEHLKESLLSMINSHKEMHNKIETGNSKNG